MIRLFRAGENIKKGEMVYCLDGEIFKMEKNTRIVKVLRVDPDEKKAYVHDGINHGTVRCFKNSGITNEHINDYVKLINDKKIVRLR